MSEFRIRESGALVSESALRKMFNASFANFDKATLDGIGVDRVYASVQPATARFEVAIRDGVEQDGHGVWIYKWAVVSIVPEDSEELATFVNEQKAQLKAEVTALRKVKEVSGTTLPNGEVISTDATSQAKITSAQVLAQLNPEIRIDWKGVDSWSSLGAAEILAIASAVGTHVQACFTAEKAHLDAIDQADVSALASYDLSAHWPS